MVKDGFGWMTVGLLKLVYKWGPACGLEVFQCRSC